MKKVFSLMLGLAAALAMSSASAEDSTAVDFKGTTTRIVVKYRDGLTQVQSVQARKMRAQAMSSRAQVPLAHVKETATGAVVYSMESPLPLADARLMALRIAQDPSVAYAAPDVRVKSHAMPNDTWASSQWSLQAPGSAFGGAGFFSAQALAGSNRVVVAVIDTGSVSHSDLSVNVIEGYDFVSDTSYAGDGNGRDNDPSDPGDFCTADGTESSWHGLKVASQIAAVSGNGAGISGAAAANTQILQVRALGRCGGWLSDVADAVTWSAGGAVVGVPVNGTPARVINLSLGAPAGSACFAYLQDAVNFAVSRNAVVVASAGNDGANEVGTPANCSGVIAVGAHTRSGDLATYSNRSAQVTLTGPGGGACQTQTGTCVSTATLALGNSGTQTPGAEQPAVFFSGTSAAAPHVAAAAAMVLAVKGDLTPAQVRSVLVSTARPHAADSFCAANPTDCGSGMLDAQAAVLAVGDPVLTTTSPTKAVAGNSSVPLSASAQGGTAPYTYSWTQVSGPSVTLAGSNTASPSFTAPAVKGNALVFTVTVTDAMGGSASEMVSVRVNNKAVLLAPSTASVQTGAPFTRTLSGTDADGDTVLYVLLQGPAGAMLQGGNLYWSQPVVGTHQFVLMATDGALDGSGDSATQTLTVTVTASSTDTPAPETGEGGGSGSGSSGGGGGGSVPLVGLLALALAAGKRWFR